MKRRPEMTAKDKWLMASLQLAFVCLDVIVAFFFYREFTGTRDMFAGMAAAEPVIQVPIQQYFLFIFVGVIPCHIALFVSNKFSRPRPRLTRALCYLIFALLTGGVPVGWGIHFWFADKAVSAGYVRCPGIAKRYDTFWPYGFSRNACDAFQRQRRLSKMTGNATPAL